MQDVLQTLENYHALAAARALLIVLIGLLLARLAGAAAQRLLLPSMGHNRAATARRLVFYLVVIFALMTALRELGFNLAVLLGAAGILTVALGFASQTSASNLISGLFLVAERPFEIGDVIVVGNTTGEVLSVDLLSVKLRTYDNLFVRVPNETLINSEITNLSRFPIRRLDLQVGVAYREDLTRVREVLMQAAQDNLLCLDFPEPLIIFRGFGDSSLDLQFSVWARRENFPKLRNSIPEDVKRAFDREGIEIPFPHRSLYAGSETEPFPIRLVQDTAPDHGQAVDPADKPEQR